MPEKNFRDLNRALLQGAIDMHVHTAPCPFSRPYDDAEVALIARDMGFKAIVVKDHHQPTTGRVYHAQKQVPGIHILGSLVLNTYVGGLNPDAVEAAVRFYDARIVWLPTVTSAAHLDCFGWPGFSKFQAIQFRRVNGLSVLREGELRPEVVDVLRLCKEGDVCLGTGHIPADEIRAVIAEAKKQGFGKLLVTHPLFDVPALSVEEQTEFASQEGVFMEYTYLPMTTVDKRRAPAETAKMIRMVGPEKCVMSTDLGNWFNPSPPEGLRCFVQSMLQCGIEPEELEVMVKQNPAYLLNLG
jgi:hypothetical protein